jgi:hypothetical protein
MNTHMMLAFHDELEKLAQQGPDLIGIPRMSSQEVRQTYNELEAMHNARVKKLKTLRPGSLRYRYNQRMARLHRQDADSFLADKQIR